MTLLAWYVACAVFGVIGGLVHARFDEAAAERRFLQWVADENAKDRALGLVGEDAP